MLLLLILILAALLINGLVFAHTLGRIVGLLRMILTTVDEIRAQFPPTERP